jgi:hypothetical protein
MYYIKVADGALQTLKEVGITSAIITYVANGVDFMDFAADSALSAAGIAFGTEIKIYDVALCIFIGEVTDPNPDASASSVAQKKYRAKSYLNQLDRIQYTQDISAYDSAAEEPAVETFPDPRVVLGLTYPSTRITNTVQIALVLDFADTVKSVPISRDATWPAGFLCPLDQKENIFCWDAIVSQLRWIPDHILRCDYSSGSTVVKLSKASDIAATSLAVTGTQADIRAVPRHDLQMVGLNVYFRKVTTVDGAAMESRTVQTAGDNMDPFATNLYVDLDGGSMEFVRQEITVAVYPVFGIPASVGLKAWLAAKVPWVSDLNSYTIKAVTRTGTHNYTNELLKGQIAKWMSVDTEEETINFTVEYDVMDGSNYIEKAEIKIPVQVTSCNGSSKVYSKISASDSGEIEPSGLAAGLYASWSKLHWDGAIQSYLVKTGYLLPGALLNISGAHASLASMAAVIQSSSIDLQTTSIDITFGTCRALEADSFTALYRAIRYRRSSTRILADQNDEEAQENDDTSLVAVPRGTSNASPATARKSIGVSETGKGVSSMAASDLATGELAKFREFTFSTDPVTGAARKLKVLATEGSIEALTTPEAAAWNGDAPSGYEWETLNIVTDGKIVARKILTKTADKSDVSTWSSTDSRLLLQCNSSGVLRLDKGYLKS